MQPGIVLNFQLTLPMKHNYTDQQLQYFQKSTPAHTRKMIMIKTRSSNSNQTLIGHWPLPEDFLPEVQNSHQRLPSRTAHPCIKVVPNPQHQIILNTFPFDKYEVEPSPLTQAILNFYRTQPGYSPATTCWYTYTVGSNGELNDQNH